MRRRVLYNTGCIIKSLSIFKLICFFVLYSVYIRCSIVWYFTAIVLILYADMPIKNCLLISEMHTCNS